MKELTLYDINKELEEVIANAVNDETGEVNPVAEAKLEQLQQDKVAKVVNVGLYIKNVEATASAIRDEEKRLAARRKVMENRAKWLREYLSRNLDGEKIEQANIRISFRKSESVEIGPFADLAAIAKKHPQLIRIEYKPQKLDIAAFIKTTGVSFEDIRIIEKQNIQIK